MIPSVNLKKQQSLSSEVIKASELLLRVLKEENSALEKGNLDKTKAIIAKKIEAVNAYSIVQESFVTYLREIKINKDNADIKKISELMNQIQAENQKNDHLLRINIEISEKIVDTYKKAQINNAVNKRGYNSQGLANASKEDKQIMPAMSLNNKI